MRLALGIDCSTTATKAVLVDPGGGVRGVGVSTYAYDTPRLMWTEQHPEVWWDAAVAAIHQALDHAGVSGDAVDAVGLTGQMHGSVLLDGHGEVVRPAILWNDQRTTEECDEIRRRLGRRRLIEITGNDALTGFTAPKLLWVQRHEPEAWQRTRHVLLPKDYLRFRLTGDHAVDVADGSGMLLFELVARTWSPEVLAALDLDASLLPAVHEGPEPTGIIAGEAAAATGLRPGTPVVAGGGDQAAGAIGVGAITPGVVAVSLGTSGVVFATTAGPTYDPEARVHAFCHAVPDRWHLMAVMLSAAGSLRWLRDVIAPEADFGTLIDEAARVPAGSDGLVFLPYLTGERSPHPDPLARGAFVGLTVRHGVPHLVRAVLEGVVFGLRENLDLMVAAGMPQPGELRLSGGGARSRLWRQILADVTETRIAVSEGEEGAALGATLLATVGAGWFPSIEAACTHGVAVGGAEVPREDVGGYREPYERYRSLYPALAPTFHATRP